MVYAMGANEEPRGGGGFDSPPQGDETERSGLADRIGDTIESLKLSMSAALSNGSAKSIEQRLENEGVEVFDPPPLSDHARTHPTRSEVLVEVQEQFRTVDLPFDEQPSDEAIQQRFFDFSYLDDYEEVERYWVNKPYAYVSVVRDAAADETRYRVTEPYLSEFEEYVLDEMTKILRNSLMYHDVDDDVSKERTFTRRAGELIREHTAAVTTLSLYKLLYYLRRDFINYGRIDPLMHDDNVEDISCDGADIPVFVYHREHRDLDTNISFDNEELVSFVARMAQRAGKHLSVSNPLVDASLPDGSRVQLSFGGDIATRGANFTIRQFTAVPDTPVDLLNWETFSVEELAYLWLAIENNRSLLFAGGTGSGKTTSLNAVSFFIPKKSKIVSIEDTPEIQLPHQNWVQSLTRDSVAQSSQGEVTMYQQLQSALRQRPEYILVGEIRTESKVALTFFQAMATGHTAYTTVHSESVMGVINRLENEPLSVPTQMIKELDIISIQKQVMVDGQRVRRNESITELISGGESGDILVNDVFQWTPEDDTYNSLVDSQVFDDIASDRGWSKTRVRQEFEDRKEVLQYMQDNDITWYEDVARTIHSFMGNSERVLDGMRDGTFDPSQLAAQPGTPEPRGLFEMPGDDDPVVEDADAAADVDAPGELDDLFDDAGAVASDPEVDSPAETGHDEESSESVATDAVDEGDDPDEADESNEATDQDESEP
jgi:flagellar protein FlaI